MPQSEAPTDLAIAAVVQARSRLQQIVERLDGRLQPILAPPATSTPSEGGPTLQATRDRYAPIVEALIEEATKIDTACDHFDEMLRRLALP